MTDPAIDGGGEPSLSQSDLTTVGRRLAAAREALGLSVADVARQIKLSVHQVEALEADDLAHLPKSPVIVKGFVRNYARLVQLDADQLLGTVHGVPGSGSEVKRTSRRREVVTFERPSRPWLKAVLGVLLIVAILLGAYEYHMDPDFFGEPAAPPAVDRPPAGLRPKPAPSLANAPLQKADPEPSALPSPAADAPGAAAEPASVAGPVIPASAAVGTLPTAAASSGAGIVRFRLERDSWIEVKDRDGNRIMNQLCKAGTEKSVQGIPPLQLVVGAASGVKVEWNDQPVNIVPFTKVDVARFTLE
jgi:cytoskeleton protein RodZ